MNRIEQIGTERSAGSCRQQDRTEQKRGQDRTEQPHIPVNHSIHRPHPPRPIQHHPLPQRERSIRPGHALLEFDLSCQETPHLHPKHRRQLCRRRRRRCRFRQPNSTTRQRRRTRDRNGESAYSSKSEEGKLKHHPKCRLPPSVPRRPVVAPINPPRALPPRRNTLHHLRYPLPYNPRRACPLHCLLNYEIGEDGANEGHERGVVAFSGREKGV